VFEFANKRFQGADNGVIAVYYPFNAGIFTAALAVIEPILQAVHSDGEKDGKSKRDKYGNSLFLQEIQ
jgi:hypothetical protein